MTTVFRETLLECSPAVDFFIPQETVAKFELYYQELLEWNARINLTAITAPADAAIKHFLDSVLVMKYIPLAGMLIDIGSGAGFPGIPLKIMNPHLSVVLVEAVRKKANFLKQMIRLLKLADIEVYNGRIEEFYRHGVFDFAVSRAFSELVLFCRLASPLIKPGGTLLAMKGGDTKELAVALETLPCGFARTALHTYELPRHKGKRSLVVLQNVSRETFMTAG